MAKQEPMSQEQVSRIAMRFLAEIERKTRKKDDVSYTMSAYLNIIGQMMAEFVFLCRSMGEDFARDQIIAGLQHHLDNSANVPIEDIEDHHGFKRFKR